MCYLLDPGLFLVYPAPDPVAPDPPAIVGPENHTYLLINLLINHM